jgi:hypothetical protein
MQFTAVLTGYACLFVRVVYYTRQATEIPHFSLENGAGFGRKFTDSGTEIALIPVRGGRTIQTPDRRHTTVM